MTTTTRRDNNDMTRRQRHDDDNDRNDDNTDTHDILTFVLDQQKSVFSPQTHTRNTLVSFSEGTHYTIVNMSILPFSGHGRMSRVGSNVPAMLRQ